MTMAMKVLIDEVVNEKNLYLSVLTIYSSPEAFTGLSDHCHLQHERPGTKGFTIYTIGLSICQ